MIASVSLKEAAQIRRHSWMKISGFPRFRVPVFPRFLSIFRWACMKKRLGVLPCFDPKRFFFVTLSPHTIVSISLPSLRWIQGRDTLGSDTNPTKGRRLGYSPCTFLALNDHFFINLKKKFS